MKFWEKYSLLPHGSGVFLFECFKEDVCTGVVPVTAYATTVRRTIIDWAKLVRKGDDIILHVTAATLKALQFEVLRQGCGSPPRFNQYVPEKKIFKKLSGEMCVRNRS